MREYVKREKYLYSWRAKPEVVQSFSVADEKKKKMVGCNYFKDEVERNGGQQSFGEKNSCAS